MTDANYTAVFLLVDRSGSMMSIKTAAEEGINGLIAAQASESIKGRRTVRIAKFDHEYIDVCRSVNPVNLAPFELDPRSSTSLLDAMARGIREFGEELEALPEARRPGNVVFAVMTDGQENSSVEFSYAQVAAMVREHEDKYGWQILYLGANQDAIAEGAKLGVQAIRSLRYNASDMGTRSATRSLIGSVALAAGGQAVSFSDLDREDALS